MQSISGQNLIPFTDYAKSKGIDEKKTFHKKTLFPIKPEDFRKCISMRICPYCTRRLYETKKGELYCKSQAKCGVFIRKEKIGRYEINCHLYFY